MSLNSNNYGNSFVANKINKKTYGWKQTHNDLDWKLLDKANTNQKLLLKEMLHINRFKPELNVQEQSELFCLLIGKNKSVSHN